MGEISDKIESLLSEFRKFHQNFGAFSNYCEAKAGEIPCSVLEYPEQSVSVAEIVGIVGALLRHVLSHCVDGFGHVWKSAFEEMDAMSHRMGNETIRQVLVRSSTNVSDEPSTFARSLTNQNASKTG